MEAVILPIIAMLIDITLIILFFSKKHIKNSETKIYSTMLLLTLIFILIGLITFIIAKLTGNLSLIEIFQKLYMLLLIVLDYYSLKYCFIVSNINTKYNKIIKFAVLGITFISMFFLLVLPLNVIFEKNLLDGEGPSYNIAVFYSLITFLIIVILTLFLTFKNRDSIIKVIPFLILIFLYVVGFILRTVYRELIFEGFFYSYILLIMYHTIENPDVKMLNEVILAKNQIEKNSKVKSEFISSMSHEIRTPLNAIVGYAQLIDYANSLEEAKENSKEIVNASNTLLNMLSNVLDISMVEVNSLELIEVKYDFKKILNDVVDLFKYKIDSKKIKLEIKVDKNINELVGDPDKIKRIFANLIDNAVKYTDKGKIKIAVSSEIKNKYCILKISVSDTGKGMDEITLKHIYNNFNRSEKYVNSSISGMGLGLSITKSLVELMDGSISCESEVGKGTTFNVEIKQRIGF